MNEEQYYNPKGVQGVGSDIKWCRRNTGGKRCNLCKHHANFNEWSVNWNFYYLTSYFSNSYNFFREFTHYKLWKPHYRKEKPIKYNIRAPRISEINTMLRKGCKPNKRCRCVSIIQRGYWYCPECWVKINRLAEIRRQHIHDLMIRPRQELKEDLLVMTLSGAL